MTRAARRCWSTRSGRQGSYYLFVDSATGEASDTAPYRLTTKLTYARAVPTALYANEFRSPEPNLCGITYLKVDVLTPAMADS